MFFGGPETGPVLFRSRLVRTCLFRSGPVLDLFRIFQHLQFKIICFVFKIRKQFFMLLLPNMSSCSFFFFFFFSGKQNIVFENSYRTYLIQRTIYYIDLILLIKIYYILFKSF